MGTKLKEYVSQAALSGKFVVVRGAPTKMVELTEKAIAGELRVNVSKNAQVHCKYPNWYSREMYKLIVIIAAIRRAQSETLRETSTIQEFVRTAADPSKIECILDCTAANASIPPFLAWVIQQHIHQNWYQYCINRSLDQSAEALDILNPQTAPTDLFSVRYWHLLHTSLYHTYSHHDASGLATFVTVRSGQKLWFSVTPREKSETVKNIDEYKALCSPFRDHEFPKAKPYWDTTVPSECVRVAIVAEKGDVM